MKFRSSKIYSLYVRFYSFFGIKPEKMKEFIKFAVVGGFGVVVNMGMFYVFTRLAGIRIEFASPMAIEMAILSNFAFNNTWTFRKRPTSVGFATRILRYHLVTALAALVNYGILLLLAKVFGMNDMIVNLIGIALGTFINFSLSSRWTWQTSENDLKDSSQERISGIEDIKTD